MAGKQLSPTLTGMNLDEEESLSLRELCRMSELQAAVVVSMVQEGVLEPHAARGSIPEEWRFPASTLTRVHIALRLQHDLGVNLAGAALALDLLEEVRSLRRRADTLEAMLSGGPFEER